MNTLNTITTTLLVALILTLGGALVIKAATTSLELTKTCQTKK